jgi:hypothetical protein
VGQTAQLPQKTGALGTDGAVRRGPGAQPLAALAREGDQLFHGIWVKDLKIV